METFAKLSRTATICHDSQSLKLHFPVDSRLRGNDGKFCKGLLDGRGSKPVPVPDTGARVKNDAPASSRHCGLDPQSRGAGQGGTGEQVQTNHFSPLP